MEVYKLGDKRVVGLLGEFDIEEGQRRAEAIVINHELLPLRKWKTPSEIIEGPFIDDWIKTDHTFFEFQGDDERYYFLRMEKTAENYYGASEKFITKEYFEKQIEGMKNRNCINTFEWEPKERKWVEVERTFKERDDIGKYVFRYADPEDSNSSKSYFDI